MQGTLCHTFHGGSRRGGENLFFQPQNREWSCTKQSKIDQWSLLLLKQVIQFEEKVDNPSSLKPYHGVQEGLISLF